MPSVVFVFILLVVMVTNDVTAVNEQLSVEPTSHNDTDVINSTDASNDTDDVIVPSTDAEVQPPNKAEDAVVQCSITPEQYDNLNEKLTELELQLEILQSSVDRIGVSSSTKTISGECPSGFIDTSDSCYRVVNSNLPWSIASLRCQTLHPDAHLVAIGNEDEQRNVDDIIDHLDNDTLDECWKYMYDGIEYIGFWTAGQRFRNPDSQSCNSPFVWKTSECSVAEMSYSQWCPGQPDFWRGQESCANMFVHKDFNVTCWNDIHCDTEMCFVCEIDR